MSDDAVPKTPTPKDVRRPIEDMLREDLARAMRAVRKLQPDVDPSPAMLQDLADRVRVPLARIDEWATGGYMKVGRLLRQIRDRIPHGGWMRLFKDGKNRVDRPIPMSLAKAEALMRLDEHKAFKDPEVLRALPLGSWRTMDELTRVEPKVLRQAVKAGRVTATMTRGAAVKLQKMRRGGDERMPVAGDPFEGLRAWLNTYEGEPQAAIDFVADYFNHRGGK